MNEILKEVEMISRKMAEIKAKFDLDKDETMKILWLKKREERRGFIRAAEMLGVRLECADTTGLVWKASVAGM